MRWSIEVELIILSIYWTRSVKREICHDNLSNFNSSTPRFSVNRKIWLQAAVPDLWKIRNCKNARDISKFRKIFCKISKEGY